ncbi:phosphotransferase [Vibrio gangliei]|uniref:phosphotransferase n=1 Tax=Vibrio gangliei TaxID=2077090 RepID=UPI000D018701|nr:phosphotransferase [Vibrio gangliei]
MLSVTECWLQATKQEPSLVMLEKQWFKQTISAQPLSGGLTNQCWKISTQCGRHYVWRPHSVSTQALSLERGNEFQILSVLQQAPFSPRVENLFSEGLLVEWVDGTTLTQVDHHDALESVMKCLSLLHRFEEGNTLFDDDLMSSHPVRSFDYARCIKTYWQSLEPEQRTPSQTYRFNHLLSLCDDLYQETLSVAPACLCHFDLGDYNIIQKDDSELVIIDWEYAAMASPILDVSTSILAGQFDVDLSVKAYAKWRLAMDIKNGNTHAKAINEPLWREMVQRWIPLLRFMALLWHSITYSLYGRASDQEAIQILSRQLALDGY